jgi:hypothetical protein
VGTGSQVQNRPDCTFSKDQISRPAAARHAWPVLFDKVLLALAITTASSFQDLLFFKVLISL